jgi:hypothetical protein
MSVLLTPFIIDILALGGSKHNLRMWQSLEDSTRNVRRCQKEIGSTPFDHSWPLWLTCMRAISCRSGSKCFRRPKTRIPPKIISKKYDTIWYNMNNDKIFCEPYFQTKPYPNVLRSNSCPRLSYLQNGISTLCHVPVTPHGSQRVVIHCRPKKFTWYPTFQDSYTPNMSG